MSQKVRSDLVIESFSHESFTHDKENFVEYHSFPEFKEGMSDKGKQK